MIIIDWRAPDWKEMPSIPRPPDSNVTQILVSLSLLLLLLVYESACKRTTARVEYTSDSFINNDQGHLKYCVSGKKTRKIDFTVGAYRQSLPCSVGNKNTVKALLTS